MVAIPPASLARLRGKYAEFEQLALVVAEALGLDTAAPFHLDLPAGQFVIDEVSPNGRAELVSTDATQ